MLSLNSSLFFFNDTATTEIYTLSLHDALPICSHKDAAGYRVEAGQLVVALKSGGTTGLKNTDRKSTRLNSSHQIISYAVFCLKKKRRKTRRTPSPGSRISR